MFFAINNNEFIHKKSNPIIIEKLNQLRIEEIEIFWQSLTNFIKIIKQLKVLSECFILNNFKREFYNAFNCNGKISIISLFLCISYYLYNNSGFYTNFIF